MNKTYMNTLCYTLALLSGPLFADTEDCCCPCTIQPHHVSLRHIEAKGIGYEKGYTTLEYMYIPELSQYDTQPFFDLRAHVFDDGKWAANAGLGVRHVTGCGVFGVNAYYDYRKTHHQRYNQAGVGLEYFARRWDVRLNGYIPFGDHEAKARNFKFDKFKGNQLIIKGKQEFVMGGVDLELGGNVARWCNSNLYLAGGPYYFHGKNKNAEGGKLRLEWNWKEYVALELSGSYDNVFHGIVQGRITLSYPFGGDFTRKSCGCTPCPDRRTAYRVVRDEIIVADKRTVRKAAINPYTNAPYNFIFVNNLSSSLGTFESPYSNILTAQSVANPYDVIYIYPGDGTTNGLNTGTGLVLQSGEMLLGAGGAYDFLTTNGMIHVPAMSTGFPHLTAATDSPVVLLSMYFPNLAAPVGNPSTIPLMAAPNRNTLTPNQISNLYITANSSTANNANVFCIGSPFGTTLVPIVKVIGGSVITNNILEAQGGAYGLNIPTGLTTQIMNNTIFSNGGTGIGINDLNQSKGPIGPYLITGNTISNFSGTTGQGILEIQGWNFEPGEPIVEILGNTISACTKGITLQCSSSVAPPNATTTPFRYNKFMRTIISNNIINGSTTYAISASNVSASPQSFLFSEIHVNSNIINSPLSSQTTVQIQNNKAPVGGASALLVAQFNNNISVTGADTVQFTAVGGSTFELEPPTGNTLTQLVNVGTIVTVPPGTINE